MTCCNRRGFIRYMVGGAALVGMAQLAPRAEGRTPPAGPARIFVARRILTMDPARPSATAVAVEHGRILAVGSLAEVEAAVRGRRAVIDRTFADQVILPGFVEAHCHIQDYGLFANIPYVGYFDRPAPDGGTLKRAATLEDVIERLRVAVLEQNARTGNPNLPLIAFGADPIYFGGQHMTKQMLDRASSTTPIFLQLDSGHVIVCNTPMLALVMQNPGWASIENTNAVIRDPATGQPTGELDELAAESVGDAAFAAANPTFFTPENLVKGLVDGGKLARRVGVTTATEGKFSAGTKAGEDAQRALFQLTTADPDFPIRVVLNYYLPEVVPVWGSGAVQHILDVRALDTEKLITGPVKVILDGSVQGYTSQLLPPGYWNNGGNPIWNVEPDDFVGLAFPFWQAGLDLVVHANGDLATQVALDGLEQMLAQFPISDHRFCCLHNPVTHEEQFAQMARLRATVNLFCPHLYIYGEQHYNITLGPDRANAMNSPMVAAKHGVPYSFHSDAPVTPLMPLFAAWCAVNRVTTNGGVLGPEHRIGVPEALHAITAGAAYLLRLENEIGSISPGKRADFAVLAEDPLAVDPMDLKDVPVTATVLGGKVFLNS